MDTVKYIHHVSKQQESGLICDVAVRVTLWHCCIAPLEEKVKFPADYSKMPLVVHHLVSHPVVNADR